MKPFMKNENRKDRFKRIAENRTKKILRYLRVLGNCANKNLYDYSEDDITKIFTAIEKETKRVKHLFNKPRDDSFSL